ncbi:MAG TPA: response regulator [bacterium]|nr:response regulator [bacterium]
MSKDITILLVDDDIDFLTQTKVRLEAEDFTVVTAESKNEAEDLLTKDEFDLAIIDIMMEDEDAGFALAYHIKSKDESMPVIITSAVTSETGMEFDAQTDEEKSWIKADTFIPKPIRYEQLFTEIERLTRE